MARPTSKTAYHVCLHGHDMDVDVTDNHPLGTVDNPLVVDIRSQPIEPFSPTLLTIDSLALAVSALANVSAIATSATELTAAEKNQLRAIYSTRIRALMPLV